MSNFNYDPNFLRRNFDDFINRGTEQLHAGNLDEAIHNLTQALKINPQDEALESVVIKLKAEKAFQLHDKQHYDDAIAIYSQLLAIRRHPDVVLWLYNRALAHFHMHRLNAALQDCYECLQIDVTVKDARELIDEILKLKAVLDRQIADITKQIQQYPTLGDLYFARARCYFYKGHFDEAIDDLTHAMELKTDWKYYALRVAVKFNKGDKQGAALDNLEAERLRAIQND